MTNAVLSRPRVLLVFRTIIINNLKILLIQRSKKDTHEPLKWEIPGGKLDKGQDLMEAAEREIIEEIGLFATAIKPLVFFNSDIGRNKKYKDIPYIQLAGLYHTDSEKVRLSFEHENYKWLKFEDALKLDLTQFTKKALLAWEVDIERYITNK